jgi:glutathione S-transferase
MLTLYHGWRSSASRRVRLCLAEKGLAFESRIIDLASMEHHSPTFLKLNPNGVIPLLILDDGRSLYQSGTICEWLDESYSLADIGAVPFVKRLDEEIAPDEMTRARHPKVAAWWASIRARPAFAVARIEPFNAQTGQG